MTEGEEMAEQALLELCGSVEHVVYHNDKNQYTVLELATEAGVATVVGLFPFVSEGGTAPGLRRLAEPPLLWGPVQGGDLRAGPARHSRRHAEVPFLRDHKRGGTCHGPANRPDLGDKAMEVLENDPARLAQIKGITPEKAREIGAELKRAYGIRELMMFLGAYGVRPEDTVQVWKQFGKGPSPASRRILTACAARAWTSASTSPTPSPRAWSWPGTTPAGSRRGCSTCCAITCKTATPACLWDKLSQAAAQLLSVDLEAVQDAVYTLCEGFQTVCENFQGRDYLFLQKQHASESYIAARMKAMASMAPHAIGGAQERLGAIEAAEGIRYADKQKEAIRAALEQGILILTGGPGTGKTTTLNAIIRLLQEAGEKVFLAAPTGRAAKRMSELTGEEAKTIPPAAASGLGRPGTSPCFTRNERNPLECDCLVIDELSMVDSYLFESVLRALPFSCRLILVGDGDQLPSVGPGNVLGD